MKSIRNPLLWFTTICFLAAGLWFSGCGTTPNTPTGQIGVNAGPNGENPTVNGGVSWDATSNINVSATGTVDQTGNWNAGFTVTFKDAVPADVTARLAKAGGVRSRDTALNVWKFPHVKSPNDPALMQAVAAAAGSGVAFTITPIK
jgi:hypothetical protein